MERHCLLYDLGCGNGGRLGLGDHLDRHAPTLVDSLKTSRVMKIRCCNWHSLCLATSRSTGDDRSVDGTVGAEASEGWVGMKHARNDIMD